MKENSGAEKGNRLFGPPPPPIFWKDTIIPFARRGWIAGNKEQLAADRLGEVALAGLGAGRLSRGKRGQAASGGVTAHPVSVPFGLSHR